MKNRTVLIISLVLLLLNIVAYVYGVILCFKVSVVSGLLALFLAPFGLLTGLLQFLFDFNLPQYLS